MCGNRVCAGIEPKPGQMVLYQLAFPSMCGNRSPNAVLFLDTTLIFMYVQDRPSTGPCSPVAFLRRNTTMTTVTVNLDLGRMDNSPTSFETYKKVLWIALDEFGLEMSEVNIDEVQIELIAESTAGQTYEVTLDVE